MFASEEPVDIIAARAAAIVDELSMATANDQNVSLLAQDLNVTNQVISNTLDALFQELNETGTVNLEQVRCVRACMCTQRQLYMLHTCVYTILPCCYAHHFCDLLLGKRREGGRNSEAVCMLTQTRSKVTMRMPM